MRADISAAFEEFVARYRPLLLARCRRFELPQWEREDCVADTLESMMLRLVRPDVRAPKEMAAYLTRALHNRLVDITRLRAARVAEAECASDWNHPGAEGAVTALISQHAIRSSAETSTGITATLSPALERLARALLDPLTDEERQLIGWESNMIPHRTIAAWLGSSHAATTKRIWRLRARLRETALRHADSLPPAERNEIERIINRRATGESATHAGHETIRLSGGPVRRRRMTEERGTAP
jgi:DNA-directed RNA polymerase specialized sigma24 family protein